MHEFIIPFTSQLNAFSLLLGGCFPLELTADYVLLIDRNILGILSKLQSQSSCNDLESSRLLNFLNSPARMINPSICAFEGNQRSVPSPVEFKNAFSEAARKITTYLPQAKLVEYEESNYNAAYKVVQNLAKRYQAECNFLVKAVPHIINRNSYSKLRATEKKLLSLCKEQGLSAYSLVVLAVLSCLYEDEAKAPLVGRGVIHPKENYGCQQAHNTISDLRALEFLAGISSSRLERKMAFCTRDKALAGFWSDLDVSKVRWHEDSFSFNVSPNRNLFPRLEQHDINTLIERLENH